MQVGDSITRGLRAAYCVLRKAYTGCMHSPIGRGGVRWYPSPLQGERGSLKDRGEEVGDTPTPPAGERPCTPFARGSTQYDSHCHQTFTPLYAVLYHWAL